MLAARGGGEEGRQEWWCELGGVQEARACLWCDWRARRRRVGMDGRGWPASEMDSTEVVGTRNGTGSRLLLRLMVLAWRNQEGDGGGVEAWMENVCERGQDKMTLSTSGSIGVRR